MPAASSNNIETVEFRLPCRKLSIIRYTVRRDFENEKLRSRTTRNRYIFEFSSTYNFGFHIYDDHGCTIFVQYLYTVDPRYPLSSNKGHVSPKVQERRRVRATNRKHVVYSGQKNDVTVITTEKPPVRGRNNNRKIRSPYRWYRSILPSIS